MTAGNAAPLDERISEAPRNVPKQVIQSIFEEILEEEEAADESCEKLIHASQPVKRPEAPATGQGMAVPGQGASDGERERADAEPSMGELHVAKASLLHSATKSTAVENGTIYPDAGCTDAQLSLTLPKTENESMEIPTLDAGPREAAVASAASEQIQSHPNGYRPRPILAFLA